MGVRGQAYTIVSSSFSNFSGNIPVIRAHNDPACPVAEICRNSILGIDIAQHPSSTVIPHGNGPSLRGGFAIRCEASYVDLRALSLLSLYTVVLDLADWRRNAAAGDEHS